MPTQKSVAEKIDLVVSSTVKNEKIQDYQNYRSHLKTKGLLKEDSYDWASVKPARKRDLELIGKPSKNYLLNHS